MQIVYASIAGAVPLILAALGGVVSERAGVINFALEGMMLSGAFAAVWASRATGNPYLGLAAAVLAGLAVAVLHAAASLWLKVNQIISSVALNLLALGTTGALLWHVYGQGTSPEAAKLPSWTVGGYSFNVLVVAPLVLAPLLWAFLKYTVWGLRLRAVGENASMARSAGVKVRAVKFAAVAFSGAMAGAAGAYISIGLLSTFNHGMTNGRGYIAVAAVIFGKWNPLGALGAALLFGFFGALGETLMGRAAIPEGFYLALPYFLTLVALCGFVGKSTPPADLGKLPQEA